MTGPQVAAPVNLQRCAHPTILTGPHSLFFRHGATLMLSMLCVGLSQHTIGQTNLRAIAERMAPTNVHLFCPENSL